MVKQWQLLKFMPLALLMWAMPGAARPTLVPDKAVTSRYEIQEGGIAQQFTEATELKQVLSPESQKDEQLREAAGRLFDQGLEQYYGASQYREAILSWQAALSLYRQLGNRQGEAASLGSLGLAYSGLGNYSLAIDFYEQSLTIAREIVDRPSEAASLGNLGGAYRSLGDYDRAIDFHEQALAIDRETGDRQGEAISLMSLGNTYHLLGNQNRAIDYHEQSLLIARDIGDRRSEAETLGSLALAYFGLGDYERAANFHGQYLIIAREIGDRQSEANALGNLGLVYRSLGAYDRAIDFHGQALAMAQAIGDRHGEANALGNLGIAYTILGNHARAIGYQVQALTISQEIGDRQGEAAALVNLGSIYESIGDYSSAIDYQGQALAIAQEVGDRQGEAAALANLGSAYENIGNYNHAIDYQSQSLAIARETGDRQGQALSLGNLGVVYERLGDYERAIDFHEQSIAVAREIGDRQGEAASLGNLGSAYLELNLLVEAGTFFYDAIAILETLRAAELSEGDKVSLFDTQFRAYKGLEQTLIHQNKPGEALEVAERGRARIFVELLSDRLSSQQSQPIASDPPDFATIQQIAAAQQSVLVEYSIHNSAPDGPALYIWVVQPTGELHFRKVSLEDQSLDLSSLVRQSRDAMGIRGRGGFELVEAASANAQLRELHQLLIDPIADLLPTDAEQRVVFIPQGEMFLVPFPALRDANGDYLIENHTVLTAPSIQTLDLTRQQRMALGSSANPSVLAIGNPTMPEVWNPEASDYQQLSDLPGAEFEAREIAEFFNVQPLINASATEQAVKQRIESAQILHFATHGLLEYGSPQDSGVQDVPGAIALAPSADEDGLLTAAEIRTLNLQAELVVLSACDTGRGRITGDGVIGLSRSFIEAGTPSVVVSLWSVPDAPTAALMTEFYRQLQQGQDKAQALRQAMLTTLENHPEPRDWAAFTLIGEAD